MENKIAAVQATEEALSQELTSLQEIAGTQLRRQLQDTQAHLEAVQVSLHQSHTFEVLQTECMCKH